MKKIRFIINPKSGTDRKKNIPALIDRYLDQKIYDFEICMTKDRGHATELAREASDKNYDVVVAVGGDGSVNETAASLIPNKTTLGIIPAGSGNGLARHLHIPVNTVDAIHLLNTGRVETIDTVKVNDHFCAGTIGIGFDAHIAHLFARSSKRGYSTYVKLVLAEFSTYKEKKFLLEIDGEKLEKNCFLLTIANSSQFGNNAVIAPYADIQDGILDISIMKRFPAIVAPFLIYRLMKNTIHHSRYFQSHRGRKIVVKNNDTIQGHIDGEPVLFNKDLVIEISPLSLQVIVPEVKQK